MGSRRDTSRALPVCLFFLFIIFTTLIFILGCVETAAVATMTATMTTTTTAAATAASSSTTAAAAPSMAAAAAAAAWGTAAAAITVAVAATAAGARDATRLEPLVCFLFCFLHYIVVLRVFCNYINVFFSTVYHMVHHGCSTPWCFNKNLRFLPYPQVWCPNGYGVTGHRCGV
jgi:hypothetical protein